MGGWGEAGKRKIKAKLISMAQCTCLDSTEHNDDLVLVIMMCRS